MPIEEDKKVKKGRKKWKFLLVLLLIIAIGGIFSKFFMQIKHIPSGYIGIKSSIGNPLDNSVDYDIKLIKGYVIFMPLYTEITVYPTTIQTAAYDSIKVNALDGTEFIVKPRISYLLDEAKAKLLYQNNKKSLGEINTGYLKEIIAHSYTTAAGTFSSDSLVSNKNAFEIEVSKTLAAKMSEIGLILKNTNSNLQIPQKIKDIIALRSQTLQNAILAEDRKKQAEAEAEIQLLEARTKSREDSLKNSAMTNHAIQKMFIEKWDGKLPVYGDTPKIYKNITE
ncbi:regulator of protease activity HflC (stomatin/prohibitin superfamily) [Dysgonomonas alginatilytica]|uniref:Regulator of protease activity HflC (Stomatin/prohibitin superfamily) n=1 Tax=Dysgonomonas alginatilytica TaxID=1605892 RepID=A0A2V3PQF0_9BACT|nr:SPFH domain-containing protein [Dysgonomonas alginatilytica]PXV63869.1 regulator of protease activity HflC (stomatin/prohibitin superfamily) [Dysgonomonas alginatilytica]